MSFFYGADGLVQAITHASEQTLTYTMANDLIREAYQAAGLNGVKQLAGDFGITYVAEADAVTPAWWVLQGMEGATPTAAETLYPAVLDSSIDNVTGDLVLETAKSVTTQGGTKVLTTGAIKTATTALSVIGAVATGAQLGWESYKEHPDFWTDLSESIFNSDNPDYPMEVIARAHAGGYTTAVKEQEMCKILQAMAAQGCFDYQEIDSNVEDVGIQPITLSEINPATTLEGLTVDRLHQTYPDETVVQIIQTSPNNVVVQSIDTSTAPETANIYKNTIDFTEDVYYASLPTHRFNGIYDPESGTYTYYELSNGSYILSGNAQRLNSDVNETGGLNVDITEYEADNDLFTNDHDDGNLHLAPTSTFSDIINALKKYFPAWYDESWLQPEYNPGTGNIDNNRYYPITIPWWDPTDETQKPPAYTPDAARRGDLEPESDPRSKPQGDTATKNNPKYITDPDLKPTVPVVPPAPTPTDPGAGAGGGSSNALWAVYNPTLAELNALGAYLWTSNIIEIIQKFLQNPMDAIISLHSIYCTPPTAGPQNIALGYLDSGVAAHVVTSQFVDVDCGSVTVPEFFSDARDYDEPYTVTEIYLPFVGIKRLKTADVVGGVVSVAYTVDLYSGACLAKVSVTKLGVKQLLYVYSGNCSMQIPLTGSDRTRLLSGAVTGAVGGAATGGPVGAAIGAIGGAFMGGTSIDRSGSFTANAGCMGVKKPYILITRKYAYDAGYYNGFYGFPSNVTVTLSQCRGYTRVRSVHIDTIRKATDNEKIEIETLLKEGVIV